MKVHKYDVDGTHYRICTGLMEGSLLVAIPAISWCCEWSPGAPPPSPEWMAAHGLPSTDCGPVAAILRRIWPAVALPTVLVEVEPWICDRCGFSDSVACRPSAHQCGDAWFSVPRSGAEQTGAGC